MVGEDVPALALQGAGEREVVGAKLEGGVLRPLQGMDDTQKGQSGSGEGRSAICSAMATTSASSEANMSYRISGRRSCRGVL
jgi:hypothetical protein